MQKLRLAFFAIALLWGASSFAQGINSGSPKVPFGSQTKYDYGIMPTNLPTSGTYGRSSAAATQYNYWVTNFVEKCSDNTYRVKFDDKSKTVSEGIAYGMLLSAYAGDKVHFDGFWAFFKKSMNKNGLMNWMTDGCSGNARDNAATDSDLDAAHALIIAAEQWPGGTYEADAKTLIGNIYKFEIDHQSFLTLSGDMWGSDACLNPSYQAPGYYRQYKAFDATNASAWGSAVTSAESLLSKNAHATTGLVSNWCDKTGAANSCGPNNPYLGYGSDACRTPWRMAIDVLWHGKATAATAYSISERMSKWLAGYETNLRGQMSQSAANPGAGSYSNGSYTTFALAPMAMDATYQKSLNDCYSFTAGMSNDGAYFNETVRCLTLFVLTGNFWKPGASGVVRAPEVLSAVTNEDGTKITVTFTKAINTSALGSASEFLVAINTVNKSGAVTGITASGTNAVILTVTPGVCVAGKSIALSYSGTSIKSSDGAALAAFKDQYVKNLLKGNSTMIDNCDDGNATNLVGGAWFTFNDAANKGLSVVTPLSTADEPLQMLGVGAESSAKSASITFTLAKGGNTYGPFVGMGTELNGADLTGTTGMSFWYKGAAFRVKVITPWPYTTPATEDFGYFGVDVPAATTWTYFSQEWAKFLPPTGWSERTAKSRSVVADLAVIQEFQWQVTGPEKDPYTGATELSVDFVECNGLVPTKLAAMSINETTDAVVETGADVILYTNPTTTKQFTDTTLHIVYTPVKATYKEVLWTSSNPSVASIKFDGKVTAISSGTVKMTAKAVVDESIVATCEVKVVGKEKLPTKLTITDAVATLNVAGTVDLGVIIEPADADNKAVTWTSSNKLFATVDASGVVTGRGAGIAVITVTSQADNTVKATVSIEVKAQSVPVTEILIDATKSLFVGDSYTFTPTVNPTTATNKALTWSSSDDTKVSVTAAGKITAVANGSAIITAKAADGSLVTATCTVTVTTKVVLADGVTLDKSTMTLDAGKTGTLVATVSPVGTVSNSNVTWKSADEAIATVSATGVVTAKAKGDVEITATAADGSGFKATCLVTVKAVTIVDLVSSITIKEGDLSLVRLATKTLTPEVLPATAVQTVTWKSNDETVVTVDAAGKITAIKVGSAIITASATDASSKTGSITVTVTPILVASVTNADVTKTIQIGKTATLTTTVLPGNADNQSVVWSSSDDAKVSVNAVTGEITGVALGSATITATAKDASGKYSSTLVTVTSDAKPVTSVKLDVATLDLTIGVAGKLTATVAPIDATNSNVIWQSSDITKATVDQKGNITAIAAGSVVISVVSMDNTALSASCTVTVKDVKVTGVTVAAPQVSLKVGELSVIEASAAPATATNKALTYASSDAAIAKVSSTGVITAVVAGTATITVTAADGSLKSASVSVTVTGAGTVAVLINKITLDKTVASVKVGGSVTATVSYIMPTDATNKAVLWTSSDESIATVTNGVITGVKVGTATILASSADEGNAVSTVLVTVTTDATLVTSITSTTTAVSLVKGSTQTVSTTVNPSTASIATLNWTSSDETVATVSSTGVIYAVKAGQAIVTAAATDGSGKTLTIPVNVTEPTATSLANEVVITAINPLMVLASATLSTTVFPPAASQSVTYVSSNESVAKVSASGVVSAIAAGTVTITAIANDGSGKKDAITVVVNAPLVVPSSISAEVDEDTLAIGEVTFYTASVAPNTATDVTYSITPSVAGIVEVVAANNAIKALAAGTVELTFKAVGNPTLTKKVTITVTAPVVVPVNKASLSAAIFTATDLIRINGSSKNASVAEYVYKLNTALASAKIVKNDAAATQAEVDAATKSLLDAINKLNTAVIKTDVTEEGVIATAVYPNPASGNITIVGSKVISSVSAVSYGGLSTVLATGVNATSAELSVAGLATATYSLVIVYTDGTSKVLALSVK